MKPVDKEAYLVWVCQKCWHLKHYDNGMADSVLCDECWDKERARDSLLALSYPDPGDPE